VKNRKKAGGSIMKEPFVLFFANPYINNR